MLIFILAFSQIVLVLSNLLIPSLVQLETFNQEQELNKLYSNVFLSTGNPIEWGTIPTHLINNYRLGLLGTTNSLDFSKMNRLVTGISDYWFINYQSAKTSFGIVRDFAVEVFSPITLTIEDINVGLGTITVTGVVQEYQTLVPNAQIWVYSIDANNGVVLNFTTTKNLAGRVSFKSSLTVNITSYYTIIAFTEIGNIYQNSNSISSSVDVRFPRQSISDSAVALSLFPSNNFNRSYQIKAMDKISDEEGDIYSCEALAIPAQGLSVVFVQEVVGSEKRAGVMGIPMFLTEGKGDIYGPITELNTQTYLTETRTMFLRNVLIKCRIWYW
ncbi:MAG: hypothetical protein ACTSSG_09145 [Candidatus Heimdallarchaeaceae archaeon]